MYLLLVFFVFTKVFFSTSPKKSHLGLIEIKNALKINQFQNAEDILSSFDFKSYIGYYNNIAFENLNFGILNLHKNKPGAACQYFKSALATLNQFNDERKNIGDVFTPKQIITAKYLLVTATFYYSISLLKCDNTKTAFYYFKNLLATFNHPLILLKMAECCIQRIFGVIFFLIYSYL